MLFFFEEAYHTYFLCHRKNVCTVKRKLDNTVFLYVLCGKNGVFNNCNMHYGLQDYKLRQNYYNNKLVLISGLL